MRDRGAFNLTAIVAAVGGGLVSFYGFLGYRARLWSPLWAIIPTSKAFASLPREPEQSPSIKEGRRLYREFRCGVCHGPDGKGGVKNPNADPDGLVPNLFDLDDAFTRRDLMEKIRKGAASERIEGKGPEPPLEMPSWSRTLRAQDIEALADYLFSLKEDGSKEED